jgi:hypothetical protein
MTLQEFALWWDDLSDPKVATSISTILDWKADIEKLCNISQDCSAQLQSQVSTLVTKIGKAANGK